MPLYTTDDPDLQRAFRFYDDNYDRIASYFLRPGAKVFLGNQHGRRQCRFCGKMAPDVTFINDAHAIPESLGNKTLFSLYECDSCNTLFGTGIENDFGNWSKPMRTLARIKGKNGVPTIKSTRGEPWRVEVDPSSTLQITSYEDNPAITVDEEKKQVHFLLHRDDYTPVAVLKALVKMGITILPVEEMVNFQHALSWIREKDHSKGPPRTEPVIHTFVPGPRPNVFIALIAFRRKHNGLKVPYTTFVLSYANEVIQVFLPSPERDQLVMGTASVCWFPNPSDAVPERRGLSETSTLDLTGTSVVKREVAPATMNFEAVTREQM